MHNRFSTCQETGRDDHDCLVDRCPHRPVFPVADAQVDVRLPPELLLLRQLLASLSYEASAFCSPYDNMATSNN